MIVNSVQKVKNLLAKIKNVPSVKTECIKIKTMLPMLLVSHVQLDSMQHKVKVLQIACNVVQVEQQIIAILHQYALTALLGSIKMVVQLKYMGVRHVLVDITPRRFLLQIVMYVKVALSGNTLKRMI